MRTWIEYLITNPSAGADFIAWTEEIDVELSKRLTTAVREDEMNKARVLSAEKTVYETIRRKVETEMRERQSQINYTAAMEET